jgi:hypothetical protein
MRHCRVRQASLSPTLVIDSGTGMRPSRTAQPTHDQRLHWATNACIASLRSRMDKTMTQQTHAMPPIETPSAARGRVERVTTNLLTFGVVVGPLWESVFWAQALTRDGFDPLRHPTSLLSNGSLGWIQIANFLLAGLMVIAAAVGIRRALAPGRARVWAPRLIGAYGVGLLGAGIFRADPADGFPPGAPGGPAATISWHSGLHYLFASLGFFALIVACLVLARRFTALRRQRWAAYSIATGVFFLAANLSGAILGTKHQVVFTVLLTTAVALAWTWIAAVTAYLYRRTAHHAAL